MSETVQKSGGFLAFLGWPSIAPHRNRGVGYTDHLRRANKLLPCDDLYQQMQQEEVAWRQAVKSDWGRTPLGMTLLMVMSVIGMDGTEANELFDNAAARTGYVRDSWDKYLTTRARYNRECLRETVEEPVAQTAAQPAEADANKMSAVPELAPWQTMLIGALSLIPAIRAMSAVPTPTVSPSMGIGVFHTSRPSLFFSPGDGA